MIDIKDKEEAALGVCTIALLILTSFDIEKGIYEMFFRVITSFFSELVYFDFLKTAINEHALVAVNFPGGGMNFSFAVGVIGGIWGIMTETKGTLRDIRSHYFKALLQSLGGFAGFFALSMLLGFLERLYGFFQVVFVAYAIGASFGAIIYIAYLISEGLKRVEESNDVHK